jgi:hypothetical protein
VHMEGELGGKLYLEGETGSCGRINLWGADNPNFQLWTVTCGIATHTAACRTMLRVRHEEHNAYKVAAVAWLLAGRTKEKRLDHMGVCVRLSRPGASGGRASTG